MPQPQHEFTTTIDGSLEVEWQQLEQKIAGYSLIFNRSDDENLAKEAGAMLDELRQQQNELKDKIKTAARVITVERLAPKKFARLMAAHPPREGDPFDKETGFNTDTFDRALMDAAITKVVDGHGNPVEGFQWADVVDEISFGQFQTIIKLALSLNTSQTAVPFSLAESENRQTSEQN